MEDLVARAHAISAYAVTLGQDWDDAIARRCDDDEAAAAWFLDQVANSWIDEAARQVEHLLELQQERRGTQRMRRVRPGYRRHPSLDAQRALCAAVEAERIGVTVTEAGTLLPSKTVTGILGWEPIE